MTLWQSVMVIYYALVIVISLLVVGNEKTGAEALKFIVSLAFFTGALTECFEILSCKPLRHGHNGHTCIAFDCEIVFL